MTTSARSLSRSESVGGDPKRHRAYRAFAELVDEVIAPRAVEVDATAVPRSHIDALREFGYYRWFVPTEFGGAPVPDAVKNAAHNLLFGADPSTATVVTQHEAPVVPAIIAATPQTLALLPRLASGDLIGGAGMGHLRAWPRRRGTVATKVPGGYRINGEIGWHSGWGLTDVIWLGAVDERRETYVFGIGDLHNSAITGRLLPLQAVVGSRTATLTLTDYLLPDEFVTSEVPVREWKAEDGLVRPEVRRARELDPGIDLDALEPVAPVGAYGLARAALDDALTAYPDDTSLHRCRANSNVQRPRCSPTRNGGRYSTRSPSGRLLLGSLRAAVPGCWQTTLRRCVPARRTSCRSAGWHQRCARRTLPHWPAPRAPSGIRGDRDGQQKASHGQHACRVGDGSLMSIDQGSAGDSRDSRDSSSASATAQEALRLNGYGDVGNVIARVGDVDHDVVVVGGGQSGVSIAYALRAAGVARVSVIDAAEGEQSGAWRTTARMRTLRTPKTISGPELGVGALSFRAWFEKTRGRGAFDALSQIPTPAWADYLSWFRQQVGIEVRYGVRLVSVAPGTGSGLRLELTHEESGVGVDGPRVRWTENVRKLILATGVSGTGGPLIPDVVAKLSHSVCAHTSQRIDFSALEGKSVAVLGAGASGLDAAAAALEAGAREVAVYTRRPDLVIASPSGPGVNPAEYDVFALLDDDERWRRRKRLADNGATVPSGSVDRVAVHANYRLHVAATWRSAQERDGTVVVDADDGSATFDFVIVGTGYQQNPATRPELVGIAADVALWRDLYTPPAGQESEVLGATPYLGPDYQFIERHPGSAPWLSDIHVFSIGANVSFGRPVGDIPSLRVGVAHLARAVVRDLVLADMARTRPAISGASSAVTATSAHDAAAATQARIGILRRAGRV